MAVLPAAVRIAAARLYATLATPTSLKQKILLRYGEWDQLATSAVDPRNYLDAVSGAERFRRDSLSVDFLRKYDLLPTSYSKEQAAETTFLDCENQCLETNYRLQMLDLLPPGDALGEAFYSIRRRARKMISRILGRLPSHIEGRFGPGTAFEMKGHVTTTLADKMWITPHVTAPAEAIFRHTVDPTYWDRWRVRLGLPHLAYTRGNRFTTVPKDGKTRRGICVEPLGNLYCQLGVGSHLKGRLANIGIYVQREPALKPLARLTHVPLPNGQSLHRSLAARASVCGDMATIDLSNASDTVSYELVRQLLPPDWFALLDALRSPMTLFKGRWFLLDKFSSMGNGFTFELETLIFCGLIHGVTGLRPGREFYVYGDDIIIPTGAARGVVAALKLFGFTPNVRKSFLEGPFRESCGGDFFLGFDVRSVFLKSEPETPLEWVSLHNALKRRLPINRQASSLLRHILDQIPSMHRVSGPSWLGDTVLHRDPVHWRPRLRGGILWVRGLGWKSDLVPLDRWGSECVINLALLGVRPSGLAPRGWPGRVRSVRLSIS
jgi:hypothetical protein